MDEGDVKDSHRWGGVQQASQIILVRSFQTFICIEAFVERWTPYFEEASLCHFRTKRF